SHAHAGARSGSDRAGDRRALGGVLLALATTLDRALLVASGLGAGISAYVLERAGHPILLILRGHHVVEHDAHLGPASDAFRRLDEGHVAVHETAFRDNRLAIGRHCLLDYSGELVTSLIGFGSERRRQPDVEYGAGRQGDAFFRCPRPSRGERRHQETRNQRLHCRSHKSLPIRTHSRTPRTHSPATQGIQQPPLLPLYTQERRFTSYPRRLRFRR